MACHPHPRFRTDAFPHVLLLAICCLFGSVIFSRAQTVVTVQPDLQVKYGTGSGTYVGNGVYNADGSAQCKQFTKARDTLGSYLVMIENDGSTVDVFTLTAPAAPTGWLVQYYDAATTGTNITTQITGEGWNTAPLATGSGVAGGGSKVIRIEVTATSNNVPPAMSLLLTATSGKDMTRADAVRIAQVRAGTLMQVNVPAGITSGDYVSDLVAISPNGRYALFTSGNNALVSADSNGTISDIFWTDLVTGAIELVSISTAGTQANWSCFAGAVSNDGRYLAYESDASNLTATDTNARRDVFLFDRTTRTTTCMSLNDSGTSTSNGSSTRCVMTNDGRYIFFHSTATDLVTGITTANQIYRYDRTVAGGARICVSTNADGIPANGTSTSQVAYDVTADGRYLVFASDASNLGKNSTRNNVYRRDLQGTEILCCSVNRANVVGNNPSSRAAISDDGRFVAFASLASNLVPNGADCKTSTPSERRGLVSCRNSVVTSNPIQQGDH